MTGTTTKRRLRPAQVAWGVSLALHALLLVALLVFDPLGITELAFSREEERQRTQEVAERERLRREAEQAQRQELRLPEEHAQRLKREAERRQQEELARRLERLLENRERIDRLRQARLEEVRQRTAGDVQRVVAAQLQAHAEALERLMEPLTEEEAVVDPADAAAVQRKAEQAARLRELAGTLRDEPLNTELAREAVQHAREIRGTMLSMANEGKFKDYHAARAAENRAFEAMGAAGSLLDEPDMAALNDTSTARGPDPPPVSPQEAGSLSAAEAYDAARRVEQQIDQAHTELRAASLALVQRTSFADAMKKITRPQVERPDLAAALGRTPATVGDLNALRQAVEQARDVVQEMTLRSEQTVRAAEAGGDEATRGRQARLEEEARLSQMLRIAGHGQVIDLTGVMGTGGQDHLQRDVDHGDAESAMREGGGERIVLNDETIFARALPGQRFSASADRQGWLYLNTWYIIGPWRMGDFSREPAHPPETGVDLDAVYDDGYVDADGPLDGTLQWRFVQTEEMRVQPPHIRADAVWYAYTEVYFEEAREMLLAIASDDAAKVWINGALVWHDTTLSPWSMGEGFRRVRFQQGYNRVLVRLINGPKHAIFSVLICPPEAANAATVAGVEG